MSIVEPKCKGLKLQVGHVYYIEVLSAYLEISISFRDKHIDEQKSN